MSAMVQPTGTTPPFPPTNLPRLNCRHNILQCGMAAHLIVSVGLPFPPQWQLQITDELLLEQLGDLIDLPVDDQQYESIWLYVNFVNFGFVTLNGSRTLGEPGNHDWYDTFWGFSSVLPDDGCQSVTFWITTNWSVSGGAAVGYSWQVPDACRDGGTGRTHTASFA